MDIEFVQPPSSIKAGEVRNKISRRLSERRHTTEVRFDQLPSHNVSELERESITSLSSEDLSPRGDGYYHPIAGGYQDQLGVKNSSHFSNGSWGDLNSSNSSSDSKRYFCKSQEDIFNEGPRLPGEGAEERAGHQYQLSYSRALDNVLTPFSSDVSDVIPTLTLSSGKKFKQSHCNHVIAEMITTETTYVRDLSEVIEGYLLPVQMRTMSDHQVESLFGNIADIRDFHGVLLKILNSSVSNVTLIGKCFLEKAEGFKKMYTQYCNNYPNSIRVLAELSKLPEVSGILKTCQKRLNHALPLGAYLLKPVQRVLKYALLLSELVKSLSDRENGYIIVKEAMVKMTEVAEHINAMKKKYDTAVHVQEIQSLMRGHETLDLTKYGDLILEESLRFSAGRGSGSTFRGRAERFVFLFQRLYLVTKKEEDGYQYKMHVEMKDLQLTERVEKEPNSYQIRQVSSGRAFTFQARNLQLKDEWVNKIKILLVESIPHLPDKAKELIMRGFEFPQEMNPTRERQRHVFGSVKSASLGRNSSPQLLHTNKHLSGRSSTSPVPIQLQGSPVHVHLSGSMTARMIASIHQPSLLHDKSESRSESPGESPPNHDNAFKEGKSQPHPLSVDQGDSGYSDTGDAINKKVDQNEVTPSQDTTPTSDESSSDHMSSITPDHTSNPLNNAHSMSEPSILPLSDHMTPHSQENRNGHTHNSDHIPSESCVTDEAETLFNYLMRNSSDQSVKEISTGNLDWGAGRNDMVTNGDRHMVSNSSNHPAHLPHHNDDSGSVGGGAVPEKAGLSSRGSSMDDESITPRASPYTSPSSIRRWSIKKRRSYDLNDPDESSTPKASPYIRRHQSASIIHGNGSGDDSFSSSDVFSPPPVLPEALLPSPDEALESGDLGQGGLVLCPNLQDSPNLLQDGLEFSSDFQVTYLDSKKHCDNGGNGDGGGGNGDGGGTLHDGGGDGSGGDDDGGGDRSKNSPILPVLEIRNKSPPSSSSKSNKSKTLPGSTHHHSPLLTPTSLRGSSRSPGSSPQSASSASVRRSQSFGNSSKYHVHHTREGSLSTDNSPLPSPIFKTKKGRRKSRDRTNHSPNTASLLRGGKKGSPLLPPPLVAIMGLIGTTRMEPDLEDVPLGDYINQERGEGGGVVLRRTMDTLILPPPEEFEVSQDFRRNSPTRYSDVSIQGGGGGGGEEERGGRGGDDRSLLSFFGFSRSKRGSRASTPTNEERRIEDESSPLATPVTTPSGVNENEMVSLDEIMESFDHYASETGKTTRTNKVDTTDQSSSSPQFAPSEAKKKKERKKKKRHGHTVANIDADTIKEVKRMAEKREREERAAASKRDTKVNKLAREYSQRIKDKSKISKRYSTAVDQPSPLAISSLGPEWKEDLRGKQRSKTVSGDNEEEEEEGDIVSGSNRPRPLPRPLSDDDIFSSYNSQLDEERATHRVHKLTHYRGGGLYQEFDDEVDKRTKFRGWVKSIAAKFGKREGTTL